MTLEAQIGREQSVATSTEQPIERLLFLGTCQKVNSHNSAFAALDRPVRLGQVSGGHLPLTRAAA